MNLRGNQIQLIGLTMILFVLAPVVAAQEGLERASWNSPDAKQIKTKLDSWLATQEIDELAKLKIEALWAEPSLPKPGLDSLYRYAETVGVVDERVASLVRQCKTTEPSRTVPKFAVLADASLAKDVRDNLRLLSATWLAQHELYDEAQEHLKGLGPAEVVDPASLLFYQGVVGHRLLKKKECLAAIEKLMENEEKIPRRYSTVARLMEADIRPLKDESLDEVARLMDDIKRRLGLGRAGTTVRKVEEDVVAKLDKMIEELEESKKKGGKSPGAGANPSQPLPDSVPAGGSGPGDVDRRRLEEGAWGNLPQKKRDEVLQQISKELPAHYREVIKEYFRKIARDGS